MTQYGNNDLNPYERSLITRELTSDTTYDTLVRDAAQKSVKEDVFANAGPFKAEVLRAWKEDAKKQNAGSFWNLFSDGFDGEIVCVKARIPELHHYPYPTNANDHKTIEMYPTFIAKQPYQTIQ